MTEPADLDRLLAGLATIAVVGLSPRTDRPSHQVAAGLQGLGLAIRPVRPAVDAILGEPAVADLAGLPGPVDAVVVFRNPAEVPAIAEATVAGGHGALWLQPGAESPEGARIATAAGLPAVVGRCLWVDYRQWRAGGCNPGLSR
ncbi:MAG: CoA-binding protein [Pseudomonadota bacterium]